MFSSVADASVNEDANGPATSRTLRASTADQALLVGRAFESTSICAGRDLPAHDAGAEPIQKAANPVPWAFPDRPDCDQRGGAAGHSRSV